MKKVRKALHELLYISLNTEQINHLGRDVDPAFNVAAVSGFGEKIVIPRRVAADCILEYFSSDEKLLKFIGYMLFRNGQPASGGLIQLKSTDEILRLLKQEGWIYNPESGRFTKDQSRNRSADWGFLAEGEEYQHVFTSIDVVGSSELTRSNIREDMEITMGRFRAFLYEHVERRNGRFWSWSGDGGLAVFHGDNSIDNAVLTMVQILSYLPLFNISQNELALKDDIRIRIGMHYGSAIYRQETHRIESPDIRKAMEIEKECAMANSIAITEPIFQSLRHKLRSSFSAAENFENMQIYLYYSH